MHLEKRLARGDRGINPLDVASREHDIAYSRNKGLMKRYGVDKIFAEEARKRITAKDSILGERESCCHSCLGGYESQNEN